MKGTQNFLSTLRNSGTSVKKNLRPDAGVRLVRDVRQVNPTASCRVPHASHVPCIVQCVSNHGVRQGHQVPKEIL